MRHHFAWVARIGVLILLVGALAAAAQSPAPDRTPRVSGPVDEADRIEAPAESPGAETPAAPLGPTQSRTLPGEPGVCRESTLTEGEAKGALTDLERAKLAMARAAVEAARAAGTLWVTLPIPRWDDVALDGARAAKLARRQGMAPLDLAPDRAAGIGEFSPVQEVGPLGPTAEELAKLHGEAPSAAPPSSAPQAPAVERREEP